MPCSDQVFSREQFQSADIADEENEVFNPYGSGPVPIERRDGDS